MIALDPIMRSQMRLELARTSVNISNAWGGTAAGLNPLEISLMAQRMKQFGLRMENMRNGPMNN